VGWSRTVWLLRNGFSAVPKLLAPLIGRQKGSDIWVPL
jgi:hypothetical protein